MRHNTPIINKDLKDFNPVVFGWEDCLPTHSFGPAIREYYLIHYVIRGDGTLYADGKAYRAGKNQIFIIKPDEVTTFTTNPEDPWEYIWIGFTGKLAGRFGDLRERIISMDGSIFFEMQKCEEYESCREEFLASKLFLLYLDLFEGKAKKLSYSKQVCTYIDTQYSHPVSVAGIADIVGLERTYLSKLFKKEMNISIQDYLINTRLQKASELLKIGFNVNEVCRMVGYTDTFNFSKMFKKKFGQSPKNFKNT